MYKQKYLKYKQKYLELKNGNNQLKGGFQVEINDELFKQGLVKHNRYNNMDCTICSLKSLGLPDEIIGYALALTNKMTGTIVEDLLSVYKEVYGEDIERVCFDTVDYIDTNGEYDDDKLLHDIFDTIDNGYASILDYGRSDLSGHTIIYAKTKTPTKYFIDPQTLKIYRDKEIITNFFSIDPDIIQICVFKSSYKISDKIDSYPSDQYKFIRGSELTRQITTTESYEIQKNKINTEKDRCYDFTSNSQNCEDANCWYDINNHVCNPSFKFITTLKID
mgnify:CR=1 FL=1|tara:strand:+ start:539 stop:1369 length:831 start_codon:yes stop_codon:yes gene_type:complete